MADILFVGTGEACDPELPNTSLLYRGRRTLLLDCGYSVPHALWRHTRDADLLDGVFVSHRHGDHTLGLPALLLWMQEMGRGRPLQLLGGRGLKDWLGELAELSFPGILDADAGFAVHPRVLEPGEQIELGPLRLRVARSEHSADNLALRVEEDGRVLCYSGDGNLTADTAELYRGADLLVHECYSAEPVSPAHAAASALVPAVEQLDVGELCLVHLGRAYKDRVRRAAHRWGGRTRVRVPAPGEVERP